MRWMKLEPIIQSEVSQKEKYQFSILMHIYGIYLGTLPLRKRGSPEKPPSLNARQVLFALSVLQP